jgi:hypothetical protein
MPLANTLIPAPTPVVPEPTPPTPVKNTNWTAIFTSKTFWGTVVATAFPIVLAWAQGTPPSVVQIITALGIILSAAGLRDWMGRIESYSAAVTTGLANANITPTK